MPYCVHCGVRLNGSEKKCPLCGTVVLDPAQPLDAAPPRPYPVRTPEQELKKSKRFLLSLSALILLLPAALCLMIDFLLGVGLSWSIYPAGALILLFIAVAVPILVPRHRVYFSLGTTFLVLNIYLFLVENLSHSGTWFFPIALPALALFTVMLTLLVLFYRKERLNKLTLLAALLAAVAVECLAIELLCSLALRGGIGFIWSPYAVTPCLFISLVLFFINGNRSVREEVRRRVHF